MELSLEVSPEGDAADPGLTSPMGGKNQRSLSLSEKWATNKALALEYLKRQREIMVWVEGVLKRTLPSSDLHESFKSGIVLRELMEVLFPQAAASAMSPISRKYSQRMAPWKERENISVFLKQCKALGMNDLSLFCTDDLYEGTNMVQVLFCIQHFMKFSAENSGHDFQPVAKHSAAMNFSSQEVEMALSKLEQAGMNASALKDLINSCDEEVRGAEVVEELGTEEGSLEATVLSIDAQADKNTSDEVLEQLELLEQDLVSGENNQQCEPTGTAEGDSPKGTETNTPEVEEVDDDADPALGDAQDAVDSGSVVGDTIQGEQVAGGNDKAEEEVIEVETPADDLREVGQLLNDLVAGIEAAMVEEAKASGDRHDEEEKKEEEKTDVPIVDTEVVVTVQDRVCESEVNTEVIETAKSETVEVDSSVHAIVEEVTEVEAQPKTTKRKKKRSKTKRARSSSDEQLEAAVMAKCACGRGCTMM